jgi:hypothetical protein
VFPYSHPADNRYASCDPDVSLNSDGLSNCSGAALRRFKGMARRDDAYVRSDHHIVGNVQATKVIESAVLIYEDISSDADFVAAGSIGMAGSVKRYRLPLYK